MEYESYQTIFYDKLKKCKSKKDYKRLCKEMIKQFEVIDDVEANQYRIFSSMIGSENYLKGMALAIKMYMLQRQGVYMDIIDLSEDYDGIDKFDI